MPRRASFPRSACCCSARSRSPASECSWPGTLRAEANLAASNALFLVLLFLGGMAYPLDKLPAALEAIAKLLPGRRALGDGARGALDHEPFPTGELVVLVVWAVAAPLLAARFFRWEE